MLPSRFWPSFVSACAFLLIGCVDQDPFGRSRKLIKTSYSLEQFEGGVYYLQNGGHPREGGDYVGGTVQEIGWTNKEIFVKRFSTSRADPDGWMVIDLLSDAIQGPFSDVEFQLSSTPRSASSPVNGSGTVSSKLVPDEFFKCKWVEG